MNQLTCAALFAVALLLSSVQAKEAGTDNVKRRVFYGDLHLHTALSMDAYAITGTKIMPEEAYAFAQGNPVSHMGQTVRRKWPLDFMAVTDHSENLGVLNELDDPASALSTSEFGKRLKSSIGPQLLREIHQLSQNPTQIRDSDRKKAMASAWQRTIDAANNYYRPGKFTTFIGYEWTSSPNQDHLHRNVIFSGDDAPFPFTAVDSPRPEDLWTYLEHHRAAGIEALAIPHNANSSNGLMYDWTNSDGKPIDQAYAQRRLLNEPLSEIVQNKGQSETHPLLSPDDTMAGFEVFDRRLYGELSLPPGSYARDAYGRGLVIEARTGTNPYKFGVVGATDFHNGLSTADEDSYDGNVGGFDPGTDLSKATRNVLNVGRPRTPFGSGALTGVWAEENTRASIYSALRRKETFATSGTRLQLRFFGGWDFDQAMLQSDRWVDTAYARGVSMGGDLPVRPRAAAASAPASAPRFLAWALKDPNGANLDRLQVIKVWLTNGQHYGKHREKVFDVAYAGNRSPGNDGGLPPIGNTVDVRSATYTNSIGASQLSAVWTDPEFDAATPAVYYLRVIEIPTPRWSTILAVRNGTPLPADAPTTIQERGWSSPIWYAPGMKR